MDLYVARTLRPSSNGKSYQSIYLRESSRQGGKVKKRDIANLSHCHPAGTAAIELALKHKDHLSARSCLDAVLLREGASAGAVWTAAEMVRRVGLPQALGSGFAGQPARWQVIARLLEQGSRLSAVRLAQVQAGGDVPGIRRGFDGSHPEGEDNAFGAYGYHRDGKKGKKQIVHAGLHGSVPRQ